MGRYKNNKDGTLDLIAGIGDTSALANKSDVVELQLTGTTNTSGGTITAGTWFYLNSKLVKAKVNIASGATFTEGTNYEEKTIGSALSELNSKIITEPQLIFDFNVPSAGWEAYTNTDSTKQALLDNARYVLVMFKPQNSSYWFPTTSPWFGGTLWAGTGQGTYCYVHDNSYSYISFSKNANYSGVINMFQWYGAIGECKLYAIL